NGPKVAICRAQECLSRDYGYNGTVCVCTSDHCDTISPPSKVEQPQYLRYTSNRDGLRFKLETGNFVPSKSTNTYEIRVNSEEKFQKVLGWGGAFTDATGINIDSLEEGLRENLLKSYFSDEGIEYSLCRVPIGGTDFSTHGYSYNDGDVDEELTNFKLAPEDFQYKIPYIRRAFNLTNGNLQLFASAWTAPKWMKTNGEYAGYGFLIETMYQSWANYFVKFLDSYLDEGIQFWGITTGNEPSLAFVIGDQINTVGWKSEDMGKWILNNLGPAVRNSVHSDINIIILDDQRSYLPSFIDTALKDNTTRQYIDGIAVHWYVDLFIPASVLTETHDKYPEKFILSTEACNGIQLGVGPVVLGSWERGELYSIDIIEDMLNWVEGWVDWNMVLDVTGGPNYIDNSVDSPIIVNATAGEFYKQPMYYHLGHFSKFVPRGSVRVSSSAVFDKKIKTVAFQRPDDGIVVIILNRKEEVVPVAIIDESRGNAEIELSARSITTILY
ncbi:glucosylceramidase-like, partial [Asbolus verrucosus]